jgi:queuine tRNA-ribosyltransferase
MLSLRKVFLSLQRFGVALVPWGQVDLKRREFSADFGPIDPDCGCVACRNHTRADLHSLAVQKEPLACSLLTIHNVAYQV